MFVDSILHDISRLKARPAKVTYTSDYFPQMLDLAERLIRAGHLYADDTPQEKMKEANSPTLNPKYFGTRSKWLALPASAEPPSS